MSVFEIDNLFIFKLDPQLVIKWEVCQDIITCALHKPKNLVGLEGPAKRPVEWERWFKGILKDDIVENYIWNTKMLQMGNTSDLLRKEIINLATKERSKLKIVQNFLARNPASISSFSSLRAKDEGINIAQSASHDLAIEIRKPLKTPNPIFEDKLRPKGDSSKRPFRDMDDDESLNPLKRACLKGDEKAKYPKPLRFFVFETSLKPSKKIKLVYVADTLSLPLFLQRVCDKWGIPKEKKVESFDFDIGGKTIEVGPSEQRDWVFVLNRIKKLGVLAVTVGINISENRV